jgi:hypothetical protein
MRLNWWSDEEELDEREAAGLGGIVGRNQGVYLGGLWDMQDRQRKYLADDDTVGPESEGVTWDRGQLKPD